MLLLLLSLAFPLLADCVWPWLCPRFADKSKTFTLHSYAQIGEAFFLQLQYNRFILLMNTKYCLLCTLHCLAVLLHGGPVNSLLNGLPVYTTDRIAKYLCWTIMPICSILVFKPETTSDLLLSLSLNNQRCYDCWFQYRISASVYFNGDMTMTHCLSAKFVAHKLFEASELVFIYWWYKNDCAHWLFSTSINSNNVRWYDLFIQWWMSDNSTFTTIAAADCLEPKKLSLRKAWNFLAKYIG